MKVRSLSVPSLAPQPPEPYAKDMTWAGMAEASSAICVAKRKKKKKKLYHGGDVPVDFKCGAKKTTPEVATAAARPFQLICTEMCAALE